MLIFYKLKFQHIHQLLYNLFQFLLSHFFALPNNNYNPNFANQTQRMNNFGESNFGNYNQNMSNTLNNNAQLSSYSNRESNLSKAPSAASTGYYKTEGNYAPDQREKYNLNRVPEAIN